MGRINNREALEPNLDTLRTTASLEHSLRFARGHISSSLIWGRNKDLPASGARILNSYSAESTVQVDRNWAWTRIENLTAIQPARRKRRPDRPSAVIHVWFRAGFADRPFVRKSGPGVPGDNVRRAAPTSAGLRKPSRRIPDLPPPSARGQHRVAHADDASTLKREGNSNTGSTRDTRLVSVRQASGRLLCVHRCDKFF